MLNMDEATLSAYDNASARFAQEWREQPAPDDMYALLRQYFTPGATVDVGCGSGRDVAWLRVNGYDASGYDASEGLVREARLACPEACFGVASLPDLEGVPRAAYANVLCETVIMHLDPSEIRRAVRNLVALLSPGGTMWLSWRVTPDESRRDDTGRLYAAFDSGIVLDALGPDTTVLVDREEHSGSSSKVVRRLIVRSCAVGSWGGRRPSPGGYVAGTGAPGGGTAAGGR
jgi:SAM-dependent methyltransferase